MAGLVPAIHALLTKQGVDARHKAGHDVERVLRGLLKRNAGIGKHTGAGVKSAP